MAEPLQSQILAMWRACGLVVLVGCSGADAPGVPDGAPMPDGPGDARNTGNSTLRLAWATTPASPGGTPGGNQLVDLRFRMESLRAIVDVDPNDPNTTRESYKLHWDGSSAPEAIEFDDAPAGRYTSIIFQLDDGDGEKAFDLRGETTDGDTFKIDDSASLSISASCDAVLAPGGELTLTIEIELGAAIDPIAFDELASGDGVDHHLHAGADPVVMAGFRARLRQAFHVRDP